MADQGDYPLPGVSEARLLLSTPNELIVEFGVRHQGKRVTRRMLDYVVSYLGFEPSDWERTGGKNEVLEEDSSARVTVRLERREPHGEVETGRLDPGTTIEMRGPNDKAARIEVLESGDVKVRFGKDKERARWRTRVYPPGDAHAVVKEWETRGFHVVGSAPDPVKTAPGAGSREKEDAGAQPDSQPPPEPDWTETGGGTPWFF